MTYFCAAPAMLIVNELYPQSMNHTLLAPQFGIGSVVNFTQDGDVALSIERVQSPLVAGPTVVVKRRRLLIAGEANTDRNANALAPARTPKVYRLDTQAKQATIEAFGDQVTVPQADAISAVRQSRSRRLDPSRRPTLVKHVVYDSPPPIEAAPPAESPSARYGRLRDALRELDEALDRTARAQRAYSQLDDLLTSLGVAANRT